MKLKQILPNLLLLLLPLFTFATTSTPTNHHCAVDRKTSITGWRSGNGYCNELGGRLCTRSGKSINRCSSSSNYCCNHLCISLINVVLLNRTFSNQHPNQCILTSS